MKRIMSEPIVQRLNERRLLLVNAVQQKLQDRMRGSPMSSPRKAETMTADEEEAEDVIPPYAPSESETSGKMISPPEELTLIPTAEFFWLLQSFDTSSKEPSFSTLFEFPAKSHLYWRLRINGRREDEMTPDSDDDGNGMREVTLQPASVPNFALNVVVEFETFVAGHQSNLNQKKTTICEFKPSQYDSQPVGKVKISLFKHGPDTAVTIRCLLKPAMAEDEFFDAYDCL